MRAGGDFSGLKNLALLASAALPADLALLVRQGMDSGDGEATPESVTSEAMFSRSPIDPVDLP